MDLFPLKKQLLNSTEPCRRNHWLTDLMIALLLFLISSSIQTLLIACEHATRYTLQMILTSPESTGFHYLPSVFRRIFAQGVDFSDAIHIVYAFPLILITILYCTVLENHSLSRLGLCCTNPVKEYVCGGLYGILTLSFAFISCFAAGVIVPHLSRSYAVYLIIPYLLAFSVQGFSEEILCRGFLFQTLSIRYSPMCGAVISSLFFASLHLLNAGISAIAFFNLFLFGFFAALYMYRRGNIWGIAAFHSAWNFTQGNIFGISVSGNPMRQSLFVIEEKSSALWLHGGSFGLEGGISVTIALILSIIIIVLIPVKNDQNRLL